ncbi:MAG: hypothetical protein BGO25_16500 [Acidobacteriales bacterium 59-55]|nr:flagella basal body P-ring formation protein FlgA [Terriglobales bacterium]OJV41328.1 MAG: hypothetical protein BGO25_16500 [Acidobacteriales bacterium 59-55]
MSKNHNSWSRAFFCWTAALILPCSTHVSFAQTGCAKTPAAAMQRFRAASSVPANTEGPGYRVTGIRPDPVLGQTWVSIANCEHPDWPEASFRVEGFDGVSSRRVERARADLFPSVPVVRAGDIVRLWRQEDLLRIEVTGVAEQSGGIGKMIRVRLLRRSMDDGPKDEELTGIVRGPSDVEMLP